MNYSGVVGIILFYVIIVLIGIWASRKRKGGDNGEEEIMLAGRSIGLFVGIFTMTATWVGGGYINGTAEAVYNSGLIWCQAPFGYALSLVFGGIFFASPMRKQGYVTMLDPLQDRFGEKMGGLLFLPAFCGEIFWAAGILAALGATISVVINMDQSTSIIGSACVAVAYTLIGGLYSVAYTDVIQLFCIFIGLWICIPFAWMNEKVDKASLKSIDWFGQVETDRIGFYIDYALLLMFGGIPWQVYFQRVLSTKTPGRAQILSFAAAFGCIILAIPPVLIGIIGKSTAWNETTYDGPFPLTSNESSMILPMVLQYLTPQFISFFGLGAIAAAVMSSADSSILSASSMFARNIYRLIFRPQASEKEVMWVMRIAIIVVGVLATLMAISVSSVYALWAICSDLVYVILFPQLLMVVHFKNHCNTYGSLAGYTVALLLRVTGGESTLGIPALILYPGFNTTTGEQCFPFRTLAMVSSLITLTIISWLTRYLFKNRIIKLDYDVFGCFDDLRESVVNSATTKTNDQSISMFGIGNMALEHSAR
uniref:CSON002383 protein n=1 Tax=Culicoides sonorensis TaxID=179676 RepID=A0A336JYC9_CULSO